MSQLDATDAAASEKLELAVLDVSHVCSAKMFMQPVPLKLCKQSQSFVMQMHSLCMKVRQNHSSLTKIVGEPQLEVQYVTADRNK